MSTTARPPTKRRRALIAALVVLAAAAALAAAPLGFTLAVELHCFLDPASCVDPSSTNR